MDHISKAASFLTVQRCYGEKVLRSEYSLDPVSAQLTPGCAPQ